MALTTCGSQAFNVCMQDAAIELARRLQVARITVVGYEIARDEALNHGPAVTVTEDGARTIASRCGVDDDAGPADVALVRAFGSDDALAGLTVNSERGNVRIGKLTRDANAAILVVLGCGKEASA